VLCPHCGTEGLPGRRFCHRCRRRIVTDDTAAVVSFVYVAPKPARPRYRRLAVAAALLVIAGLAVAARTIVERQRRNADAAEGLALVRLQAIGTAQLRYASVNGAGFDTLPCLAHPEGCLPNVPAGFAPFLAPELAVPDVQHGYRLVFHPGPPPHGDRDPDRHSPSSLAAYACVAQPVAGGPSGRRTFCADSTGRLCVIGSPDAPELADGVCPLLCTDLRLTPQQP